MPALTPRTWEGDLPYYHSVLLGNRSFADVIRARCQQTGLERAVTQRLVPFEESLDTEVHREVGERQLQDRSTMDGQPISRSWKRPGKTFPRSLLRDLPHLDLGLPASRPVENKCLLFPQAQEAKRL